ncbi:unnamed protein product, partial [Pleuronectes platessa]
MEEEKEEEGEEGINGDPLQLLSPTAPPCGREWGSARASGLAACSRYIQATACLTSTRLQTFRTHSNKY